MAGRLQIHDSEEAANAGEPGLTYEPLPDSDSSQRPRNKSKDTGMLIAAATPQPGETRSDIEYTLLFPSPTNRKRFDKDKMRELEASVAAAGIIVPLIVRIRKEGGYEIVCGERRWMSIDGANAIRSKSGAPPILTLPCVVRTMTDVEALQAQCIENAQREDVSPFDQGRMYRALCSNGCNPKEIAKLVGMSPESVYNKMKLLELVEDGVKAFDDGMLPESSALVVARMPPPIQTKIIATLVIGREKPMTFDDFRVAVADKFMTDLTRAPFDTDAPFAGREACAACGYRSGNCRASCPDVKSPDVCLDPECFRTKRETATTAAVEKLSSKGYEVLGKTASANAFTGDALRPNSAYVEMDAKHPSNSRGATWEQLVGKAEKKLADDAPHTKKLVLVSPAGRALRVYERTAAERAIGVTEKTDPRPAERSTSKKDERATDRRDDSDKKVREGVTTMVALRLAARAKEKGLDVMCARLILEEMLDPNGPATDACLETCREMLEIGPNDSPYERLHKLGTGDLDALLSIAAMDVGDAFDVGAGYADTLKALAKMLSVDLKKMELEVSKLIEAEVSEEEADEK